MKKYRGLECSQILENASHIYYTCVGLNNDDFAKDTISIIFIREHKAEGSIEELTINEAFIKWENEQ